MDGKLYCLPIGEWKMDKYICRVCATIYEPEAGDPDNGVSPGTSFEKLPEGWICPVCGSTKDKYEILSQERYEQLKPFIYKK